MIHRLKVVVKVISVMIMAAVMLQIYRIDPLHHKTLNAILAANVQLIFEFAIITTESHDAVLGFLLPTWPHRSSSRNFEVIGIRD